MSAYQKGGIVVNGGSDSADIHNNTVTGLGRVNFIAGNGIQVAFGASGDVHNNTVTGNAYTGANNASSAGILVFGGCGDPVSVVDVHNNTLVNNDMGVYFANYDDACVAPSPTPTKGDIHNNSISNDAVTNISGNGSPIGYQAGIARSATATTSTTTRSPASGYAPMDPGTAFVRPIDIDLHAERQVPQQHLQRQPVQRLETTLPALTEGPAPAGPSPSRLSSVPAFLIYGTFMRGQPGHANLDGAELLGDVETAPRYRLWEVDGRWPALISDDDGVAIAAELYEIAPAHLARLAEIEPPGWSRAPVELADGRQVEAFLGAPGLRARGHDVSTHGGWAAYRASRASRGRGS